MNSTTKTNHSIVFFGTGEVSLATLEGICAEITIEAVITKPDLMTSGGKAVPPAIKIWAKKSQIPCFQPANKTELVELCTSNKFISKAGLVVDYGMIIPQSVIDSFEMGILNSHFSLLPLWRGADPITWSILAGDKVTGVTVMSIDAGMDTGDIIESRSLQIATDETSQTLTARLIGLSNDLLKQSLPTYLSGDAELAAQDDLKATYSSKITKELGRMNPQHKTAEELEREIRAFQQWPSSYFKYESTIVTVLSACVSDINAPIGKLVRSNKELILGCKDGSLKIERLRLPSRSTITAQDFMNSHPEIMRIDRTI